MQIEADFAEVFARYGTRFVKDRVSAGPKKTEWATLQVRRIFAAVPSYLPASFLYSEFAMPSDPLPRKPLHFIGTSKEDLRAMPEPVKDELGAALLDAQFGEGLPREVMKLVEDHDGDTYRAAYTVAFPRAVYVLHVFKKKSARGIAHSPAGPGNDP